MKNLPFVSIITPSYNSAGFIARAIQSVAIQEYPNIEHIIVDGGSTDGTVDILRGHSNIKWISEKDSGQSEALNKGITLAKGAVIGWLNSDDFYHPSVISQAVKALSSSDAETVYGNTDVIDSEGNFLRKIKPEPVTKQSLTFFWRKGDSILTGPSLFFKKSLFDRIGLFNETLDLAMDYDLFIRAVQSSEFLYVDETWGTFVLHSGSKSSRGFSKYLPECYQISKPYWKNFGTFTVVKIWFEYQKNIASPADLDNAFESYENKNRSAMRKYLFSAIIKNPLILSNKGIWSIAIQSIVGEKQYQKMKKPFNGR
jgi:glycosyltransferase involved in cell wall biosynthesis